MRWQAEPRKEYTWWIKYGSEEHGRREGTTVILFILDCNWIIFRGSGFLCSTCGFFQFTWLVMVLLAGWLLLLGQAKRRRRGGVAAPAISSSAAAKEEEDYYSV